MKKAPKWKMAILIWLAIYPALNLVSILIGGLLVDLPLWQRTFVMTVILVPLMVYVLLPFLTKKFAFWLNPKVTEKEVNA